MRFSGVRLLTWNLSWSLLIAADSIGSLYGEFILEYNMAFIENKELCNIEPYNIPGNGRDTLPAGG